MTPANWCGACLTPNHVCRCRGGEKIAGRQIAQNIMDRESPFEYRSSTGGGNPCACDITKGLYGRTFQVRIVKTW